MYFSYSRCIHVSVHEEHVAPVVVNNEAELVDLAHLFEDYHKLVLEVL